MYIIPQKWEIFVNVVENAGRFIMWGQDIQGTKTSKPNNLNFSPCSKAVVQKVLYSGTVRGKCLTPGENEIPYCGNGIHFVQLNCAYDSYN